MTPTPEKRSVINEWMPALVTAAVLATALPVIVQPTADQTARLWATGIVGTIVGYWFNEAQKRR